MARLSTLNRHFSRHFTLLLSSSLLLTMPVQAQSRGTIAEFERANRIAEALRQVSVQGNLRNPGYYSDWQVKGDRIGVWSRQCLGQSISPEQFEGDRGAAATIVTCIVQDMLRQEIRSAQNNEGLAIRRIASWWVTGDPNRYNDNGIAPYTQRVLSTYQPNGLITAAPPAAQKPIYIPPVTSTNPPIASNPAPTAQPLPNPIPNPLPSSVPNPLPSPVPNPSQVSVPTETLPPVKPRVTPGAPTPAPSPKPSPAPAPSSTPTAIKASGSSFYDRYMNEGYSASKTREYDRAILFFRRALDERPEDQKATEAIRNMEAAQGNR
ncbi:MAG: hypothetical protein RLZZ511_932 [Cyanobacteriota bacterium]|jgi:hypothetical protein